MRYQRISAEQKTEMLELVRKSPVSAKATLEQLGIARSTYYSWLRRKRQEGPAGLADCTSRAGPPWNRLRDEEVAAALRYARIHTDLSCRELACTVTDQAGFSVSESTVYRILRRHGLTAPARMEVARADPEFRRKTKRVHELWQTDVTYFFVHGWGWYYIGRLLDDYSRYLITYTVVTDMSSRA